MFVRIDKAVNGWLIQEIGQASDLSERVSQLYVAHDFSTIDAVLRRIFADTHGKTATEPGPRTGAAEGPLIAPDTDRYKDPHWEPPIPRT